MPFDPTKFYLGVNIAWLNHAYGHDLGHAFHDLANTFGFPWPADPPQDLKFEEIVGAYFNHLELRKIKVVRWWLLEWLEGMTFSGTSYMSPNLGDHFGLDRYLTSVEPRVKIIMRAAHQHGIQIYWCLLDAAALLKTNSPPAWYIPLFRFLVSSARANFKADILTPFLDTLLSMNTSVHPSVPYTQNVFAIDIANEADWSWLNGTVSRNDMASFVSEVHQQIALRGLKSTVSFANYSQLEGHNDFNFVDFYDYHRYYDPDRPNSKDHGDLPVWVNGKACIIGEVGHQYGKKKDKGKLDEVKQASSCRTVMQQALGRNYAGALLWRYAPVGDVHRLLRRASGDTAQVVNSPAPSTFLNGFILASGGSTAGGLNPYQAYERQVWDGVKNFVIPPGRIP